MTAFPPFLLRRWPIFALLASAAMLAAAHAFQTFGGLQPCTLCLRQRDVYWLAMAVAAIGAVLGFIPIDRRLIALVSLGLAVIFVIGAGVAAYHSGAEWKWWPGPGACSGGGGAATAQGLAALMRGAKYAAPRCDEAAWRMLGLSMAGYNVLISLGLAGFSLAAARRVWTGASNTESPT